MSRITGALLPVGLAAVAVALLLPGPAASAAPGGAAAPGGSAASGAAAASGTSATPGASAEDGGGLSIEAPRTYFTQSSDPTRATLPVTVDAGDTPVRGITLTVDASEVRGKVRLSAKRVCKQGAGYRFTCRLTSSDHRHALTDLVVLGADKSAEPGAHGTVRFSATGPDGRRAEAGTEMTAGSAQLWSRKLTIEDAPAGRPVEIRGAGVLNHGPVTAPRFTVSVIADPRITLVRTYRNCRYTPTGQSVAHCTFDTPVEPGRAVAFTAPILADGGPSLTRGSVSFRAFVPGQDADSPLDSQAGEPPTVRGSGPELGLRPTENKGFSAAGGHVAIDTDQRVEVRAVGGELSGRTGDIVGLDVGLRNSGPGRIDHRHLDYRITPPEGTTLMAPAKPSLDPEGDMEYEPWACGPWRSGERRYTCSAGSLDPGETATLKVRFRLDRAAPGAAGRVTTVLKHGFGERDRNQENNTEAIRVRITGAREQGTGAEEAGHRADGTTDEAGPGRTMAVGTAVCILIALAGAVTGYRIRRRRGTD
ncbi:hypothetical protein [Streptomyces sp. bgisy100]|uniref:hypothetical protein n=1 Tax=Streptomyces sp. bgisy100 TaxID=3413783 RepID=UPI003D721F10